MSLVVTLVVGLLNALGTVLPQLPGLIDAIKGHPELNDGGKAVLAALDTRIAEHEQKADATAPLPEPAQPDPKPTAPG